MILQFNTKAKEGNIQLRKTSFHQWGWTVFNEHPLTFICFIILIIICVSQLVDPEGYDWLKEGESCPNADKEGDPLIINPQKYNSATMYSSSTWTESNCPIKYSHLPKVPRLAKSGQTNYKLDDFWYYYVLLWVNTVVVWVSDQLLGFRPKLLLCVNSEYFFCWTDSVM